MRLLLLALVLIVAMACEDDPTQRRHDQFATVAAIADTARTVCAAAGAAGFNVNVDTYGVYPTGGFSCRFDLGDNGRENRHEPSTR